MSERKKERKRSLNNLSMLLQMGLAISPTYELITIKEPFYILWLFIKTKVADSNE